MTQFIAFVVSVFIALGLTNAAMMFNASHRVQIHMPPPADQPAGVSGGGPVGSGPVSVPTPPPVTHGP